MKLVVQGQGEINLTQQDLLAQGGEGQVFVRNGIAYKVYLDHKKAIPLGKIQELSVLTHEPSPGSIIIKPDNILLDSKGHNVGYTMRYVKDTVALCKAFTRTYRKRNNISEQTILELVRKLQNIVSFCHKNNILIVDLNELNYLITEDATKLYGIDVDSYQTKSFPATAIMENIRDRQVKNNKWTTGSDWFSFAIISFNLFVGIHPYKGKHPTIGSWEERMDRNVSIFDSNVSLPAVCYPLTVIPEAYLNWFKGVLKDGKREAPPNDPFSVANVAIVVKTVNGSNLFEIVELDSFNSDIIDIIWSPTKAVLTTNGAIINGKTYPAPLDSKIICLPGRNTIIAANIDNGLLKLKNLTNKTDVPTILSASEIMKYDNRLYIKSNNAIYELNLTDIGNNIIAGSSQVANVLPYGSKLFDGCVIQNLLGSTYVSFFPDSGKHYQLNIKELDGQKIIDAKFERKVLMVITNKGGKYNKYIIRLASAYDGYDIKEYKDVNYSGINFTVLDNGICAHLNEDDKLVLFPAQRNNNQAKEVEDDVLDGDMRLFSCGVQTMFYKGNKAYSIKMR